MNIKITGDLVVNSSFHLDSDLIEFFNNSDLNIVNLEAPITNSSTKILKTGPHIKSDMEYTKRVLKELRVDLVTLANNHVLDYSEQGLKDTLDFCIQNNVAATGAGLNLKDASKTYYIENVTGRVGIVNFAENEWANATEDSAGANPMDTINNAKQIKEAKLNADYVIVIVHGGHEYYHLPSPRMQKQYRFYVDCGADLIVGHHPHCISGFEIYNTVHIYYSLGNFLFTKDSNNKDWYTGLVLEVEIKDDGLFTEFHPVQLEKEKFKLSLVKGKDKSSILARVSSYSKTITSKSDLYKEWVDYIESKYNHYLNRWSVYSFIKNRYLRGILRRLGYEGINKKGTSIFLNHMRCEAHSDLSKEIIQKYLSKK